MELKFEPGVHHRDTAEQFGGAGGDVGALRLETAGSAPLTVVEFTSQDHETLRVPGGSARYLMITFGAPAAAFLREIGQIYSEGPTLERLVEVAARHGVRLADDVA